jgi:ABC-2 type transport system ATP-binding protein
METIIKAKGLTKTYGNSFALNNFSFELGSGRIMGLIGPNGAGKTTALRCLMGMTSYQGDLSVLGRNPKTERMAMLSEVAYIADTAILPSWMTVAQLLEYTAGVHTKFDLARANNFLAQTKISKQSKVSTLSKGMVTQVHLALAISIDAKLLVLDEPTIGLDILYRKRFYEQLLNDYFDQGKTILITTHQIEEVEHLLTDLLFIKNGDTILNMDMESIAQRFVELEVSDQNLAQARTFMPIHERQGFGATLLIFDGLDAEKLVGLGKTRTPSIADLFVATMG